MKLSEICIPPKTTLEKTMQVIEKTGFGLSFVISDQKFLGLVTDSDIRRALLAGKNLQTPVSEVMNRTPVTFNENWDKKEISDLTKDPKVKEKFLTKNLLIIPVLNTKHQITDFVMVSLKGYEGKFSDEEHKQIPIKRVLVVGGAGYLGSVLCKRLIQKGYLVKVLDNLTYKDPGLKNLLGHPSFEFIKGDMRDIQTLVKSVEDVDAVIHLAALVGDQACKENPRSTIETNYFATKTLAEVCKFSQINRFIFASSCSVYGEGTDDKIIETSKTNPVSLYAEMKLKSEEAVLSLKDSSFSPTVFRMATLFGLSDRMRFDLVINLLSVKAIFEHKISIFGGDQWRPFLHVKDASEAYIRCLETPIDKVSGQIFNIGSEGFNYRIRQIGKLVGIIIKNTEIITEKTVTDKRDYNVCFEKAVKILGINPQFGVEKGIYEIYQETMNGKFTDYKDKKYSNSAYLEGMD